MFRVVALAEVSDWNSFRVNQNYSDSFRYLYASQCESFQTIVNLVWWKKVKNQTELIQLISRHQSEWIRTNPKPNFQSRSIRINSSSKIDSDWKFGSDQSRSGLICIEKLVSDSFGFIRIHSDWCLGINWIKSDLFLTVFNQTRFKTFFGLVRNDSHWLGYRYRTESE